jgi:hypothetical protein
MLSDVGDYHSRILIGVYVYLNIFIPMEKCTRNMQSNSGKHANYYIIKVYEITINSSQYPVAVYKKNCIYLISS